MDTFRLFPRQASEMAPQVDALYFFLIAVSAFFTALIFVVIVFFALKYRRKNDNERPPHIHTNYALELAWTVIPLGLTMIMFFWGAKLYIKAQHPPKDATEIYVFGKRWMWHIQHPEGRREINALHVPLGKAIQLSLISQDVIHDFAIPEFRVKQDVRPGWYSHEWFTPTAVGEYHLFCDQYCGAKHAEMIGTVYVMEPHDYQSWLAGAVSDESPRTAGERLFNSYGCITCHAAYAPTLAGVYGRQVEVTDDTGNRTKVLADEAYLRESILYPAAKIVYGYPNRMPSFKGELSEEQLMQLIEYIKSLSGAADTGPYDPKLETGPSTQPSPFQPRIQNPPFSNYRANQ
jgi:cytochrome c oxidase subunit 2